MNKKCAVCGVAFSCGIGQGNQACWCSAYPAIMPLKVKQDCYCKSCLIKAINQYIDEAIKTHTHEQMLEMASQYREDTSLIEGIDYDINEEGVYVFSEWFHLKRGACCGNGCVKCPY